ncbi:M14 family zinc carboxypeptidase [Streptomyces spinoverrucosus]|uniref:M14 family zinc carboxypeptidase n=1 Tax=Streptomyces spinoverrucosus TaxID=284043 RepID=UPI00142EB5A2|nr:M14 family zinc carboxypeptidase [Streptomyces spinoverrucosus]
MAETESAIAGLHSAYPGATEVITPPHTTHEGRTTRLLRVETRQADEVPGVLMLGGVHAREWVPPDALISLAADLLEAHDSATGLGYGSKSYTAPQVHTAKFAPDADVHTSDKPCDPQVYRGPTAASEPETRNVVCNWGSDQNQATVPTDNFRNPGSRPGAGTAGRRIGEFITEGDLKTAVALAEEMNDAVRAVAPPRHTERKGRRLRVRRPLWRRDQPCHGHQDQEEDHLVGQEDSVLRGRTDHLAAALHPQPWT